MCYGCWESVGKPAKITPAIAEASKLVRKLYSDYDCTGGGLHIVTDDWNLSDHDLAACREPPSDVNETILGDEDGEDDGGSTEPFDAESSPEQRALEAAILTALESMPEIERHTVLALSEGFIDENGVEKHP